MWILVAVCRPSRPWNETAVIDRRGHARGLEPGKVHLDDQPLEEGKDLVKRHITSQVRGERLIDGAVPKSDVHRLLGNTNFSRVSEAVSIVIREHVAFQCAEPTKDQDVSKSYGSARRRNRNGVEAEKGVQIGVPGHQLIGSGRNVFNGKRAVFVARRCILSCLAQQETRSDQRIIQADPCIRNWNPREKTLQCRGPGEVVHAEGSCDRSGGARGGVSVPLERSEGLAFEGGVSGRAHLHKTVERVLETRTKPLYKELGLIRLDPGIHRGGPFYGGGLRPCHGLAAIV